MSKRLITLLLAAALLFALTACSSGDEPQAPAGDKPSAAQPGENPAPGETPPGQPGENGGKPAEKPDGQPQAPDSAGGQTPEASKPDDSKPDASKPDSSKPDASKPGDSESKPEEGGDFTIADIWADIQAVGGDLVASLGALDDDTLTTLYPLSTGDLDEYGYYGSLMNVQATEFFIAKVKSGKMDAVKAAVLSRQADLDAQWKQYLPDQYELVKNYKLVQNGDYLFFGIAEKVSAAVDVFNRYTK